MYRGLLVTASLAAIMLAGCNRDRDDSAAREAGRAAYKLRQESEKAARRAAKEAREAGREAREGWNDARREDTSKPPESGKPR